MTYGIAATGERESWKLEQSNSEAPFLPLQKVTTTAATGPDIQLEQIKYAMSLNLPRFHSLPDFIQAKDKSQIAVLVGGGPSINKPEVFDELYKLYCDGATIFACGSSNDWLMENGIVPNYTTLCDPDEITALYLSKISSKTKYLVASACHKAVFDRLKRSQVYMWHCNGAIDHQTMMELDPDFGAIDGGCTVGLRTVCIAIMLGYSNVHLFGFDSSLSDDDSHHAYEFKDPTKEFMGEILTLKLGLIKNNQPYEKSYRCLGYHLGQAEQFKDFYNAYGAYFTPTFHGDGLLPDFINLIQSEMKRLQENPHEIIEDWRLT